MIDQEGIARMVQGLLDPATEFVVEVSVGPDSRIQVLVDSDASITLDRCVALSRAIEQQLDREQEDFALEVSSAGATAPLRMPRQFVKHIGRTVEVLLLSGIKRVGQLTAATDQTFTIEVEEAVRVEGKKRRQTIRQPYTLRYPEAKWTKVRVEVR